MLGRVRHCLSFCAVPCASEKLEAILILSFSAFWDMQVIRHSFPHATVSRRTARAWALCQISRADWVLMLPRTGNPRKQASTSRSCGCKSCGVYPTRPDLLRGSLLAKMIGHQGQYRLGCLDRLSRALHRNYLVNDPLELGQIGFLDPQFVIGFGRPPAHRLWAYGGRADCLCPLDKTGEVSEISRIEGRLYRNRKSIP